MSSEARLVILAFKNRIQHLIRQLRLLMNGVMGQEADKYHGSRIAVQHDTGDGFGPVFWLAVVRVPRPCPRIIVVAIIRMPAVELENLTSLTGPYIMVYSVTYTAR